MIQILKTLGFAINIKTNSKILTGSYKTCRKQNNILIYINNYFNHPPGIFFKYLYLSVRDYENL